MARPRSNDKRNAILLAAIQVFAERGLAAPTSAISASAGVAEGTLFIYFRTKDDLLNALYREIKMELADAIMSGFPRRKSVLMRLRHIWDSATDWGVTNPEGGLVLNQLQISDRVTEESRIAGTAPFAEIARVAQDALDQHLLREIPLDFIGATMDSLIQTTVRFIAANPDDAGRYQTMGFEAFWRAVARR
jgi:AcrR family transcriptional regulator